MSAVFPVAGHEVEHDHQQSQRRHNETGDQGQEPCLGRLFLIDQIERQRTKKYEQHQRRDCAAGRNAAPGVGVDVRRAANRSRLWRRSKCGDLCQADVAKFAVLQADPNVVSWCIRIFIDIQRRAGGDNVDDPGCGVRTFEYTQTLCGMKSIHESRAACRAVMARGRVERATHSAEDQQTPFIGDLGQIPGSAGRGYGYVPLFGVSRGIAFRHFPLVRFGSQRSVLSVRIVPGLSCLGAKPAGC